MNLLSKLIEALFWLLLCLSPILIFGLMSVFAYSIFHSKELSIGICVVGIIAGIFFAEKIRKKYGTSRFYGRLLRTPELETKDADDQSAI